MAKSYLNKEERTQVLTLASFVTFLDEAIVGWTGRKSKDQVKYAKMASAFGQKVLDTIFDDLAPDVMDKLVGVYEGGKQIKQGEIDKMTVVTRYTDDAVREYKAMLEIDTMTPVETDDFYEIVALGLASCSVCEMIGQEVVECPCRRLFVKYDVSPLDAEPGDGCPYRINRSENYEDADEETT